jgi:hypothetical protein
MLKQVLEDEPGWARMLKVVEVELGSASENERPSFASGVNARSSTLAFGGRKRNPLV